ncbi:hypothetical protein NEOLEDRAFT_382391 [Neolentinus lepideus HHB14362 ss-1]|uniref:Uncharacterized protein n=1 Tax=Neolentinus lepideus HHB14362 ss-1 TaxID=1314782 RepID=A0A165SD98_9AGAM|nr:hypothetical protein NEOLEDRAFT_382391 [Neolentinus lepideus HHB14362 ss-1]
MAPPEAIALTLLEAPSLDEPANYAKYSVDIIRSYVSLCQPDSSIESVPLSEDCRNLLRDVEAWVREIPQREDAKKETEVKFEVERQARVQRQRELEEEHQKQDKDAQISYKQRLLKLTGFKCKCPEDDGFTGLCPTCRTVLAHCSMCAIVSCPRSGCPGQGTDQLERPPLHFDLVCFSCRTTGSWKDRPMGQCPTCEVFHASKYLIWCQGAVKGHHTRRRL